MFCTAVRALAPLISRASGSVGGFLLFHKDTPRSVIQGLERPCLHVAHAEGLNF